MQRLSKSGRVLVSVVLAVAWLALPAAAQQEQAAAAAQTPSQADVQRLQDAVYDAGADIARLRAHDAARADRLQARLDELRDEVTYLKVKQRKDAVSRSEYGAVRNRLEDLRAEARSALPSAESRSQETSGDTRRGGVTGGNVGAGDERRPPAGTAGARGETRPAQQGTSSRSDEIPAGTELDVRLDSALSSGTAQVEDRVTATTVADLYNGERLMIPAGSAVRGVVTSVDKAGRVERTGRLALSFDRVTVKGRAYSIHGTVTEALESGGYRQDAGKIGTGAGVGAVIGGILGGLRGALAGILIGGGGVVAATEGQDVNLPAGTVLRIRLESPLTLR